MVLILSLLCVGRYGNAGQLAGHRWLAAWPTVAATAAAAVPAAAAAFLLLLRLPLRLVLDAALSCYACCAWVGTGTLVS